MKKLFKHLAIVLALALVIGLVPARTAEAADYSLKFKNKYLYVGAKGETAHGVDSVGNLPAKPIKRSLKFGKGVIKGLGDSDVVTFKSADRAVAKGSKKFQRVFAVGVGETDVAVKVNGEEIGSMHFIVKQNAKSLAIDAASELGIGDVEIKVNVEPANATDIISLVIPEEFADIAVVKEGTTITTKKPGTFKIQAVAQQNDSTLTGYHVKSEEVELQAAVKVISATQKSSDEVTFVFDNDMTGIADAKDFKVYYKPVTGADVTTAVKSVTIASEDGKTVVVKLWNAFLEDTEYFVEYSGQVTKFTTAKLDIAHAAQIRFDETEITKGKVTEYEFTVLDANGVEMSDDMKQYVTFAGTSTDKIQVGDSTILFDEAGLQVSVTGTFDAWYEDSEGNAKENKFQNAALFKSVDVTPVTLSKYYWTLGDFGGDTDVAADPDSYEEASHLVAVEDELIGTSSLFNMYLIFSDGSEYSYATGIAGPLEGSVNDAFFNPDALDDPFSASLPGNISVEIADPGIAESHNGFIKAVKVGTTQILVKVVGEEKPFLVLPLEVKAKAVPTTMKVSAVDDKVKLNTKNVFTDSVAFDVEVEDQYGRYFDPATLTVEKASSTGDVAFKDDTDPFDVNWDALNETYRMTFNSGNTNDSDITGTGVMVLKFTATGRGKTITNSTKSIQCKENVGAISTYKLLTPNSKVNQKLGAALDGAADKVYSPVGMYPIDSAGYTLALPTNAPLFTGEAMFAGVTGTVYVFKAFNGGKELKKSADYLVSNVENGLFSSVTVADDGNKTIEKLDAKSVTIKLYKVVLDDASKIKSQTSIDTKTIAITDTQPGLAIKKLDDHIDAPTVAAIIAKPAFSVKYLSVDRIASADFDAALGTKSVFVKSVTYTEGAITVFAGTPFEITGCELDITAPVNYTLVVD